MGGVVFRNKGGFHLKLRTAPEGATRTVTYRNPIKGNFKRR